MKPKECAEYILQGKLDERLLSIYREEIPSESHKNFLNKSPKDRLRYVPSFGPFHKDNNMDRIFNYLENLFETNAGEEPFKNSYIYEVWIPEALINALSVVKNMNLEDAETIFYSIQVDDKARADNDRLESV
nr:uncharacterized protein LOC107451375 [Parasteatoda tepidariorum]